MNHAIFKFSFMGGLHFGNGTLNDTDFSIRADQIFSAAYIEAIKLGREGELLSAVEDGGLRISNAFPYSGDRLYIPKPMIFIEGRDDGDSTVRKWHKKLSYVPVDLFSEYLKGNITKGADVETDFGVRERRTFAAVRKEGDPSPVEIGVFHFENGKGLYVLVAYEAERELGLAADLLEAVSYVGLGGGRSRGLGRFSVCKGEVPKELGKMLANPSGKFMLLSSALPRDDELDASLHGASYLLERRSGFVLSDDYDDRQRRKKDGYMFSAGSCFETWFDGTVSDVGGAGGHPVYRYGKSMFVGVG